MSAVAGKRAAQAAHRGWHGWHLFHEVVAGFGLFEFVQHVYNNGGEMWITLQHLMELISK